MHISPWLASMFPLAVMSRSDLSAFSLRCLFKAFVQLLKGRMQLHRAAGASCSAEDGIGSMDEPRSERPSAALPTLGTVAVRATSRVWRHVSSRDVYAAVAHAL